MHLQRKGYHSSIKGIYERGTFSVKNGIQKGKGLDLGAVPPLIKNCCGRPSGGCLSFLPVEERMVVLV